MKRQALPAPPATPTPKVKRRGRDSFLGISPSCTPVIMLKGRRSPARP